MASRDSRQLANTLLAKVAGDEAALRAITESQGVPDEAIGPKGNISIDIGGAP